jgi:hypothetical protein
VKLKPVGDKKCSHLDLQQKEPQLQEQKTLENKYNDATQAQ